jgi:RNA polymerase sigma-70 factor, ECF subfamily
LDYSTLDDASLLRLVARNRNDALGEIYDRYGRLVFSIAYNAISDLTIAEEITQEVFTRVWEKAGTYNAQVGKVSTWLVTITRNRVIDELRRRRVRGENNSVAWDLLPPGQGLVVDGPENDVEKYRLKSLIRDALRTLPEEQQKVLAMAYYQGYSQSEIAGLLGEPLGTIKTRLRLAMQKLRRMLSDEHFSGE